MREDAKRTRIFPFDSGTRIEIFWHHGLACWMATIEKPNLNFVHIQGFGPSRLVAARELRKSYAAIITLRMQGAIRK